MRKEPASGGMVAIPRSNPFSAPPAEERTRIPQSIIATAFAIRPRNPPSCGARRTRRLPRGVIGITLRAQRSGAPGAARITPRTSLRARRETREPTGEKRDVFVARGADYLVCLARGGPCRAHADRIERPGRRPDAQHDPPRPRLLRCRGHPDAAPASRRVGGDVAAGRAGPLVLDAGLGDVPRSPDDGLPPLPRLVARPRRRARSFGQWRRRGDLHLAPVHAAVDARSGLVVAAAGLVCGTAGLD